MYIYIRLVHPLRFTDLLYKHYSNSFHAARDRVAPLFNSVDSNKLAPNVAKSSESTCVFLQFSQLSINEIKSCHLAADQQWKSINNLFSMAKVNEF